MPAREPAEELPYPSGKRVTQRAASGRVEQRMKHVVARQRNHSQPRRDDEDLHIESAPSSIGRDTPQGASLPIPHIEMSQLARLPPAKVASRLGVLRFSNAQE